ncbi:hypothetical protein RD792_011450 [Penstemon davidsonii]|uniref:cysteine--tRNA ligase n=1 Tax=Penstemon davidsonii TaxID=160366 RepID=A0ABR0D609_9LAMI|nr:hypothetical protein RD792_011450 [Penstemon davidsonii]
MYVCGVTSYDYSHIGHARAYVAFDVLYRYLKYLGYEVVYVRNFTDVDDKIIRRANEQNEEPKELSGRFCQEFLRDMADLQCLLPTHQPRVTDHMEQIKDMIAQIISNGCAYAVDGDVYFSVDNFPKYGILSGRKLEDNRAGERVAVDSRKRNPADFALWKFKNVREAVCHCAGCKARGATMGQPLGSRETRMAHRVQCHECSLLAHTFDIHGGGMDLIFPHHENEIAQSCAACSQSKVNYWMHNGFVTANDEKMSKSLGNFFTIRQVTESYHPLALRYFLLGTHYRSPVNYSISQIDIASEAVFYIYQTLQDFEDTLSALKQESEANSKPSRISQAAQESIKKIKECIIKLHNEFETKLGDDLQTQPILNAALLEALRFMNNSKKQQKQQQLATADSLICLKEEVVKVLDVLGLHSSSTYTEVLQQLKDKALKRALLTEDDILHSIEERTLARKNKEFSKSDEIRSSLATKGIALRDIGNGTIWRPCVPVVQQEQQGVPLPQEQPSTPAQQENPPLPAEKL